MDQYYINLCLIQEHGIITEYVTGHDGKVAECAVDLGEYYHQMHGAWRSPSVDFGRTSIHGEK